MTGFHNDSAKLRIYSRLSQTCPRVLERSFAHFLHTPCPFPRPFRRLGALSGSNFWLRAHARKGADAMVRAAKYHAGSWPRQSTAINLKKGGQTELPLFTCTRRRLRPRIGDRKRREGAPQFCTTCVGNERAEKRAAEASRKLISPGSGVIARNFVRMRVSWERNLYLPDFFKAIIIACRGRL